MDIRRVQGNMPPVGLCLCVLYATLRFYNVCNQLSICKDYSNNILIDSQFNEIFWWRFKKILTTLVARLVRASLSGRWRSERSGFGPHSDYKFFISKSHIVLYWFAPSFRLLVLRSKILAHRSVQNAVNNRSHPYRKFVYQLIFISSETTGSFSRLSFPTFRSNYS